MILRGKRAVDKLQLVMTSSGFRQLIAWSEQFAILAIVGVQAGERMTREPHVRDHAMKLRVVHATLVAQQIHEQRMLLALLAIAACLLQMLANEGLNWSAHLSLSCVRNATAAKRGTSVH